MDNQVCTHTCTRPLPPFEAHVGSGKTSVKWPEEEMAQQQHHACTPGYSPQPLQVNTPTMLVFAQGQHTHTTRR